MNGNQKKGDFQITREQVLERGKKALAKLGEEATPRLPRKPSAFSSTPTPNPNIKNNKGCLLFFVFAIIITIGLTLQSN
jgi:hypothetical protein